MADFDSRKTLKEALKLALDGDEEPDSIRDPIKNPRELSQLEKSAWLQLHNWYADRELRDQFPYHKEFSQRRLNALILMLEN